MSVVIVGGHDRMVRQYKEICEDRSVEGEGIYPDADRTG